MFNFLVSEQPAPARFCTNCWALDPRAHRLQQTAHSDASEGIKPCCCQRQPHKLASGTPSQGCPCTTQHAQHLQVQAGIAPVHAPVHPTQRQTCQADSQGMLWATTHSAEAVRRTASTRARPAQP